VVIVGAGISGLVTAQALAAKYSDRVPSFLVTEARERVGGNITSMASDDGYVWEEGPNSFQPNDSMLEIAVSCSSEHAGPAPAPQRPSTAAPPPSPALNRPQVDAGVDKDLVFGDPKAPRFVFWEGKLRATPSGPDALTFDLLSIWGKIRAGLGAVGLYKSGPMPGGASRGAAHGSSRLPACLFPPAGRAGRGRGRGRGTCRPFRAQTRRSRWSSSSGATWAPRCSSAS
jgi:oxygen-dependent protoporphyrinogen oxidase